MKTKKFHSPSPSFASSSGSRPLSSLEIAETLGALVLSQIPSLISRSLISHEKIPGLSRLYSSILASTSGVATRGLLPPITPGRMLPVSWYRLRIFETQPWETRSCLGAEFFRLIIVDFKERKRRKGFA